MRRFWLVVFLLLTACTNPSPPPPETSLPTDSGLLETLIATQLSVLTVTPTETVTPEPPRSLVICMGSEPESLFVYADASLAARGIRQAIYDGPIDILGYRPSGVILAELPSLDAGSLTQEPVEVQPGTLIINASGELAVLKEGTSYLPSSCTESSCAQTYSGNAPVQMDITVAHFTLKPDVRWSDGETLTADDSLYAFELAKALYPRVRPDLLDHTASYTALDFEHLEWKGIPGYRDPRLASFFFSPLPRHAWGFLSPEEIMTSDLTNRTPLGWGPYQIEEWTPGDHITLQQNPNYFRSSEGLPAFDTLVYRFVDSGEEAVQALLAGECDLVDETAGLEGNLDELVALRDAGRLAFSVAQGTAWELLSFNLAPLNPDQPALFSSVETRQAIASCIDRERMVAELYQGQSKTLNSYVPPTHPLVSTDIATYTYDPTAAGELFAAVGWLDPDGDPATPRVAQGVPGVEAGTAFSFVLQTIDAPASRLVAQIIQEGLAACGIQAQVEAVPWDELLAPGPDGPVFGRQYAAAQYGWISAQEPPCFLFTSPEIPGPYPDAPKGWGGANAGGYNNPSFDAACQQASTSLPGSQAYGEAHFQAQAIFARELPALPLYQRVQVIAYRTDMCGVKIDASTGSALWSLESFDYGETCP